MEDDRRPISSIQDARVATEMIFAAFVSDGFGLGLHQEQNVHPAVVPVLGQAIQGGVPRVCRTRYTARTGLGETLAE